MEPRPEGLVPYRRTAEFTETTVPAGLLRDHKLAAGTWGVIHVISGHLRYVVPSRQENIVLSPELDGVIEPETLHAVAPEGPVRFYVEFWH